MKLLQTATVAAAALCSAANAQRPVPAYMGIEELTQPIVDGNRAQLNVTRHFGDKRVHLSYDVEHADDSFSLKLDEVVGLDSVSCTADAVTLTFSSEEEANNALSSVTEAGLDKVLITGSPQWGCKKRVLHEQPHRARPLITPDGVILRKASTDDVDQDGVTVTISTEEAHYSDVFKNANIRLRASAFPADGFRQHTHSFKEEEQVEEQEEEEPVVDETPTAQDLLLGMPARSKRALLTQRQSVQEDDSADRRNLKFWKWVEKAASSTAKAFVKTVSKVGSTVVKDVETVGKDVAKVGKDVVDVVEDGVELLVSGSLDVDKTETLGSLSWNYNGAGGASESSIEIGTDLYCESCYAHAELDLILDLDIADYKVSTFKVAAEGEFEASLTTTLSASYTKTFTYNKTVATLTLPTITFYISAIPITIDISAPVYVGIDATIKADAEISATGAVSGSAEFGLQYSDGSFGWISDKSFSATGGLTAASAEATAVLDLWVMPVPTLTVEHIGGPDFSVKPALQLTAVGEINQDVLEVLGIEATDDNSDGSLTDECSNGISLAVSLGVEAAIGAEIDIEILDMEVFEWTSSQKVVYSTSDPLTSGCYSAGSLRRRATPTSLLDVETYDTLQVGDLLSGRIQVDQDVSSKCYDMFGGNPSTDLHMHMRVASRLDGAGDNGEDVFLVVNTINYADSTNATTTPFACVHQQMATWEVFPDTYAVMEPAADQEGVNYTSCTNGAVPQLEFVCTGYDGSVICADTSACVEIELFKENDGRTGATTVATAGKEIATKCYSLTNQTDCLQTSSCGWCVSDETSDDTNDYVMGCVQGPNPYRSLPWQTPSGDRITNCNRGWFGFDDALA